jgi:hypothetical protein
MFNTFLLVRIIPGHNRFSRFRITQIDRLVGHIGRNEDKIAGLIKGRFL